MRIERLERFKRKLKRLSPETRREMKPALEISADEINDLQRRFAPVRTGRLRSTIGNRPIPETDGLAVQLHAGGPATTKPVRNSSKGNAPNFDYALADEFGAQDMAARPFFFPGFRLGKKRAKSRIARAMTKAARKVASQ